MFELGETKVRINAKPTTLCLSKKANTPIHFFSSCFDNKTIRLIDQNVSIRVSSHCSITRTCAILLCSC